MALRLEIPEELELLEAQRDELQAAGLYAEAEIAQVNLENVKAQEEQRRLQDLAAKHDQELLLQEQGCASSYQSFAKHWDDHIRQLKRDLADEGRGLQEKHQQERDDMQSRFATETARHRASKELLDLRCKEGHLRRQCMFKQANQVKQKADALEQRELSASTDGMNIKHGLEMHQLVERQSKEMSAVQHKHRVALSQAVTMQQRELETLTKRFQASRLALQRIQGQERLVLEQALKGWFNARKVFGPVTTHATPERISTGGYFRAQRPGTAPTTMIHHRVQHTPHAAIGATGNGQKAGSISQSEQNRSGMSHQQGCGTRCNTAIPSSTRRQQQPGQQQTLNKDASVNGLQPKQNGMCVGLASLPNPYRNAIPAATNQRDKSHADSSAKQIHVRPASNRVSSNGKIGGRLVTSRESSSAKCSAVDSYGADGLYSFQHAHVTAGKLE